MISTSPAPIIDLIEAFRRSKTMFVAVSLGIFDRLRRGPADLAALAQHTGANADALERLLDGCVGLGLLARAATAYVNTPVADTYLCRDSSEALTGYILYSETVLYPLWANLEDAIREGTHRWQQTFGLEGPIFSHFFRTEEDTRTFLLGMHGFGRISSPRVVRAFDLARFRRLVDLGSATGHLPIAACECYPELHGAIFDLPPVIKLAREQVDRSPARDRIQCVAGDFFADPLPPADLYAMGQILHDWSPEKIDRLLRKIHDALPEGGALLIAEKLLEEGKEAPTRAQMQSLNMLVCTEGKERTLSEYASLLQAAGFQSVEGKVTDATLDAVLALK